MGTIYYKTLKTSDTGRKFQDLVDKAKIIQLEIETFCAAINATKKYAYKGIMATGLGAVEFIESPDMKLWKKYPSLEGYYTPRLSSKEGKELQKKFYSFETIKKFAVNDIIGLKAFLYTCGYYNDTPSGFFGFMIESSWNHTMPADCVEITFGEFEKLKYL